MKKIAISLFVIGCVTLTGCSSFSNSLERTSLNFTNKGANITCYSGGKLIYSGESTTKVTDSEGSDGFYWNDKDGFVEVAADCVFRY